MRRCLALALVPCLCLGALAEADDPVPPSLVEGNTAFACDLYGRLAGEEGNLFFSPWSVSTCLSMTREGARAGTAAEMDRVLHFPESRRTAGFEDLIGALEAPLVREGWGDDAEQVPAYEIAVANRLFGQAGYVFRPAFLDVVREAYGAGLEQLDIRSDPSGARAYINGWVEEQTRDRIQDLLPQGTPTPDTRLVLVNAIYFKASWETPFRERATTTEAFHRLDGQTTDVPLMHRVGRYAYAGDEEVQVLELPYRGGDMSMVVVLPRARDGLPAVEAALDAEQLARWTAALRGAKVDVRLPRFEFASGFDLTRTLQAMGMQQAFSAEAADFSGMTVEEPLYIGIVVHKAFVAVDEKGTEAAAATAVGMRAGAAPAPEEPVEFRADHPFLFWIRHRPTDSVLFLGRVVAPE